MHINDGEVTTQDGGLLKDDSFLDFFSSIKELLRSLVAIADSEIEFLFINIRIRIIIFIVLRTNYVCISLITKSIFLWLVLSAAIRIALSLAWFVILRLTWLRFLEEVALGFCRRSTFD